MMSSCLVGAHMLPMIARVIKSLATLGTFPRLFARMQIQVGLEVITLRELFATRLTLVRLFARVYAHVIAQVECIAELFVALSARKGPCARMYQLFVAF